MKVKTKNHYTHMQDQPTRLVPITTTQENNTRQCSKHPSVVTADNPPSAATRLGRMAHPAIECMRYLRGPEHTARVLPLRARAIHDDPRASASPLPATEQLPTLVTTGQASNQNAAAHLATPFVLCISAEAVDLERMQPGTLTRGEPTMITLKSHKFTGMGTQRRGESSGQTPMRIFFPRSDNL